jgi:hypothetical protein
MKIAVWIILFLVAGVLGYSLWSQREAFKEVERAAAVFIAQRDSAVADAIAAQKTADSLAFVTDSLEAVRAEEKEAAARRAEALAARADELTEQIAFLLPPEVVAVEVQEAVIAAVQEIRNTYEERITDLNNLLLLSDETIEKLQSAAVVRERVNASLHRALAAEVQRGDLLDAALHPGFLGGLWKEKGPLSAALTLGVVAGAALGG